MYRTFLLLSLLLLCGCGKLNLSAAPQVDEDPLATLHEEETPVEAPPPLADDVQPLVAESAGPDPLAAEPAAAQGLKSGDGRPKMYLNCYGWARNDYPGHSITVLYEADKAKIQAWCNSRGISYSEANVPGALKANVRFAQKPRDGWQRDITYGRGQEYFPTYVMTDASGRARWYHVGPIDIESLSFVWDLANGDRVAGGYVCDENGCRRIQ